MTRVQDRRSCRCHVVVLADEPVNGARSCPVTNFRRAPSPGLGQRPTPALVSRRVSLENSSGPAPRGKLASVADRFHSLDRLLRAIELATRETSASGEAGGSFWALRQRGAESETVGARRSIASADIRRLFAHGRESEPEQAPDRLGRPLLLRLVKHQPARRQCVRPQAASRVGCRSARRMRQSGTHCETTGVSPEQRRDWPACWLLLALWKRASRPAVRAL